MDHINALQVLASESAKKRALERKLAMNSLDDFDLSPSFAGGGLGVSVDEHVNENALGNSLNNSFANLSDMSAVFGMDGYSPSPIATVLQGNPNEVSFEGSQLGTLNEFDLGGCGTGFTSVKRKRLVDNMTAYSSSDLSEPAVERLIFANHGMPPGSCVKVRPERMEIDETEEDYLAHLNRSQSFNTSSFIPVIDQSVQISSHTDSMTDNDCTITNESLCTSVDDAGNTTAVLAYNSRQTSSQSSNCSGMPLTRTALKKRKYVLDGKIPKTHVEFSSPENPQRNKSNQEADGLTNALVQLKNSPVVTK